MFKNVTGCQSYRTVSLLKNAPDINHKVDLPLYIDVGPQSLTSARIAFPPCYIFQPSGYANFPPSLTRFAWKEFLPPFIEGDNVVYTKGEFHEWMMLEKTRNGRNSWLTSASLSAAAQLKPFPERSFCIYVWFPHVTFDVSPLYYQSDYDYYHIESEWHQYSSNNTCRGVIHWILSAAEWHRAFSLARLYLLLKMFWTGSVLGYFVYGIQDARRTCLSFDHQDLRQLSRWSRLALWKWLIRWS